MREAPANLKTKPSIDARDPLRRGGIGRKAALGAAALLIVALVSVKAFHAARSMTAPAASEARLVHADHPTDGPESLSIAEFKAFALNALLIPLLDDSTPLRWLDPFVTTITSLAINCVGATVSIDGQPIVPDALVPARAFTLRWHLNQCALLNGHISASGDIEMLVFHDGDQYSASVHPEGLTVISSDGRETLTRSFAASTPLSPWTPP